MDQNNGVTTVKAPKKSGKHSLRDAQNKEQPFFNIVTDGHGIQYQVVNFHNPKVLQREGIIIVETIKKMNRVEPRKSVSFVVDPQTKLVWGLPLGINSTTKQMEWRRFTILDRREYNLANFDDAVEWAIVRNAEWMKGSQWPVGVPIYQVFDKEAEAYEEINKESIRKKAQDIYDSGLKIEDHIDIVRVMGGNPAGKTPTQLHGEVIKIKNNNPKRFVEIWETGNREALIIFERCLAYQIIKQSTKGEGFIWKDSLPMGLSKPLAVDFMVKNQNILLAGKQESEAAQNQAMAYLNKNSKEKAFFTMDNVETDPEVVELRLALATMGQKDLGNMGKEQLSALYEKLTSQ